MDKIRLGFEVDTGKPVDIPLAHTAVTGITQLSGKTTTLEALIARAPHGINALAFVTKRGERSFRQAVLAPPIFRQRSDWQFVSSLLEATLREKLKFERSWIMKVCKGTKTLHEVRDNIRKQLKTARGLSESVYTTLDAYLDIVLPQIDRVVFKQKLELAAGLNVMDLSMFSLEMQALVIRSAMEYVYECLTDTVIIIPEAWEFVPQQRGSPVKLAAEGLIRKGATLRNFVWLDSQDLAQVDKNILRSVSVWILGVQREMNEVERVLKYLPMGSPRPKAQDIMALAKGEFFACFGREMYRTYVQPNWLGEDMSIAVAKGLYPTPVGPPARVTLLNEPPANLTLLKVDSMPEEVPVQEDDMGYKEDYERERSLRIALETQVRNLQNEIERIKSSLHTTATELVREPAAATPIPLLSQTDVLLNYESFRARFLRDPEVLQVLAVQREIEVKVERVVVQADGNTLYGRLALLIAEGYFENVFGGTAAMKELERRGWSSAKPNVYRELNNLVTAGFLTKEEGGFQAVPGMKSNIRKVRESSASSSR